MRQRRTVTDIYRRNRLHLFIAMISISILSLKQKKVSIFINAFHTLSTSRIMPSTSMVDSRLHHLIQARSTPTHSQISMTTSSTTNNASSSLLTNNDRIQLELRIKEKGDEIRLLKESGSDKATIAPLVEQLLSLKATLSSLTTTTTSTSDSGQKQDIQNKSERKTSSEQAPTDVDDAESDFITPRSENYSKWYNDIIRVTGLAEPSPVRGCMVIKPWGMSLWDMIRNDLDHRIKQRGVDNAYFPLLIPKSFLSKEAEHVEGFAKECAVVTHHRLTMDTSGQNRGLIADPEAELEDPLIIRPTSETMIWNMFKKWIKSHRYGSRNIFFANIIDILL